MAVVAAFEFQNLVAAGVTSRQAQGTHGGFGAGADHSNLFNRWHDFANFVGKLSFQSRWCPEAQTQF